MLGILLYAVILLTYALPWSKVGEVYYSPGQLVLPYIKYFLTSVHILASNENTPPSIGDVFVYEKGLRYLGAPPSEGGPNNQITFELMGYAMAAVFIVSLLCLVRSPLSISVSLRLRFACKSTSIHSIPCY